MKRRLKCAEPQQINKGMRFYYDLHVHSCLSPCADDDNTPNNLAGMAKLCGLNVVALTDHNTTKNCPAFFEACGRYGIVPIPGMELTTSEDIHVICLFPSLESAMSFGEEVEKRRVPIKNRADILPLTDRFFTQALFLCKSPIANRPCFRIYFNITDLIGKIKSSK